MSTYEASLFKDEYSPAVMFADATSATTIDRFPRGEAVEYREHALALGVPDEAILVEPRAANTSQNIKFSRQLLHQRRVEVGNVILISMHAACSDWPRPTA